MDERKKAKKYCAAFNCFNTDRDRNLTFFCLPKDADRRRTWLLAIDREDLLSKDNLKHSSYYVCSLHFEKSAIRIVQKLNEDANPTLLISNLSQEASSQTHVDKSNDGNAKPSSKVKNKISDVVIKKATTMSVMTQTELSLMSHEETQTSVLHSANTPLKRYLKEEVRTTKTKNRRLEIEIKKFKKN